MTSTYEKIATTTLGSAQANVTFSSISGAYTDLVLIINSKFTSASQDTLCQLNDDTTNNYTGTIIRGSGSAAASTRYTGSASLYFDNYGGTTALENTYIVNFMNYSNTTTFKTILSRFSNASAGVEASAQLYRSTSAITKIKIYPSGGNLDTGSTFTLYGIKAE
jgi:hypothetical protein